jgi:hypothetical protein
MPFICVAAEIETPVVVETLKVATSEGAFGIVMGFQFIAAFQSPEDPPTHWALPAKTDGTAKKSNAVIDPSSGRPG